MLAWGSGAMEGQAPGVPKIRHPGRSARSPRVGPKARPRTGSDPGPSRASLFVKSAHPRECGDPGFLFVHGRTRTITDAGLRAAHEGILKPPSSRSASRASCPSRSSWFEAFCALRARPCPSVCVRGQKKAWVPAFAGMSGVGVRPVRLGPGSEPVLGRAFGPTRGRSSSAPSGMTDYFGCVEALSCAPLRKAGAPPIVAP